ncbi:hypothetical protein C5167_000937 [Papaver somniferum]|uniref:Uncharacterized protein n=1 Tax=Papaver somniferum TaxID=3469 RepID=A0A4Y7KTU2_PAPSO|nr:hypothetical protein C5167_000937 [Papaver somniferum]
MVKFESSTTRKNNIISTQLDLQGCEDNEVDMEQELVERHLQRIIGACGSRRGALISNNEYSSVLTMLFDF